MESRCHAGKVIEYDTVTNLSWTPDLRKHGIEQVINNLLGKPWAPAEEVGREVPEAKVQEDCVVSTSLSFVRFACNVSDSELRSYRSASAGSSGTF